MQHRRSKRLKRVAAAILSAVLIVTELPQTDLVFAAQEESSQTEIFTEEHIEAESQEVSSPEQLSSEAETPEVETQVPEQTTETETKESEAASESESEAKTTETDTSTSEVETEIETESQSETESSSSSTESEPVESETESQEIETTETTEIETTETETTEMETTEIETTEEETETEIPVPVVDTGVYEYKDLAFSLKKSNHISIQGMESSSLEETDGKYILNNKDEFLAFINSSSSYSGKTVELNCNIDMKNEVIGFSQTFEGTFDGKGYSIINFRTSNGLFQEIERNGNVQNLHISNASFDGESSAGIVAGNTRGKIENVLVTGNLTVTKEMNYTGGIAGNNTGILRNCAFSGSITADGTDKYIGGIAGKNGGTIENCYTTGTITGKAAVVAGIAGENNSTIKNCYNYMNVSGAASIAGIASRNLGTIEVCRNYGSVNQNNMQADNGQAGGIAAGNERTIINCGNYGVVTGTGNNIGGIAGYTANGIAECGNYGAVQGKSNVAGIAGLYHDSSTNEISKCFNMGAIKGSGQGIGGILGSTEENSDVKLVNCYNMGNISASGDNIGGIAGILKTGSIENCYNAGKLIVGADSIAGAVAGFLGETVECKKSYFEVESHSIMYNNKKGDFAGTEYRKSEAELKDGSVVDLLGDAFSGDSNNLNNGYPVLNGQQDKDYKYLVVYELNGGQSEKYFEIVQENRSISAPEAPQKAHARFLGWFSDKALNTAFSSGQISKATILYAGWENAVTVEKIELVNTKTKLVKGSIYEIAVTYTPENATNKELIWKSGDPTVATVEAVGDKGIVTAVSAGNTQITARLADNSLSTVLTFSVEVSIDDNIVWIRDENTGKDIEELDVAVNEEYNIEAVISGDVPSGAKIQWGSSKPEIAKIEKVEDDATGKRVKVIGVSTGNTTITATFRATSTSKPVSASLDVRVRPQATDVSIMLGDKDASGKTIIYDYGTFKFVALGTGKGNRLETPVSSLGVEVRPANAGQKVEWISEKTDILEFTDKYSGKFEIKSNGEVKITAKTLDSSNKSATVTVDVKKIVQTLSIEPKEISKNTPVVIDSKKRIVLTSGQSIKLIPIYAPSDATKKDIAWDSISGDTRLLKPEKKDGIWVVTAQPVTKETEVTMTARSLDLGPLGDGATFKVTFVIKPKVTKINIYREEDMRTPVTDKNIGVNPEVDDKTITLRVKNEPDNSSQVVTWKSSNESIATIKDNKDGSCIVTVKDRIGQSTITASATDGSGITAKTTVNVTIKVTDIIIKGSYSVRKGKSIQLTAQIEPASAPNKEVTWESLNPDKAVVDKNTGKVTGISAGVAQIVATATDGSRVKATHTVIVTDAIKHFKIVPYNEKAEYDKLKPEEVPALNGKTIGLDPDAQKNTYKLDIYVNPIEACQTVTWKSSNEKVATVSEDGTVTAVGLGKATVSATSTDGSGKKASVTVNVNALSKSVTVTGSHYVGAGKSIQLKAEVGDKDAANKNVVWSSSNKGVLTVDNTGKVSPVSGKTLGNSVIRAEAADGSGKYAEHKVYIMGAADDVEIADFNTGYPIKLDEKNKKYIDLDMGDKETLEIQLSAVLSGGTSYLDKQKDVIWSSSNKNVATVTSEVINGKSVATVTLTSAEGSAVITAKTADGYNKKDTCTINVENSNPVVRITGPKQVALKKKIQLSAGKTAISSWTSSDPSVATVNAKGQVTAKALGNVIITAEAKVGTNTGTYEISVREPVKEVKIYAPDGTGGMEDVTGKKLGMDILKGYEGSTNLQLSAETKFDALLSGIPVTWKSNKTSVAKVDENGTVEALKAGTAKITATATDGSGKKATVTIVVAKQVTGIEAVNGVLSEDGKAYEVRVAYNKSVQLKVSYLPLAATTKKVTWKVRDEDKSYISVSSTGKVKAKQYLGNYAVVYATAADNGGITCEFRIFVTEPTYKVEVTKEKEDKTLETFAAKSTLGIDIDINNKLELGARFTTKDGKELPYQGVTWKSGNTKIATVDSNGVVTGLKVGKTTITATAADGTNKSCKINLYVGKLITRIDIEEDALKEKFPRLRKGKTIKLMDYIMIRPITATNQKLTFKSTNKNVLTVNSKGVITSKGVYKKNGITYNKAKIQILTNDGTNILEEIEIEVTN